MDLLLKLRLRLLELNEGGFCSDGRLQYDRKVSSECCAMRLERFIFLIQALRLGSNNQSMTSA